MHANKTEAIPNSHRAPGFYFGFASIRVHSRFLTCAVIAKVRARLITPAFRETPAVSGRHRPTDCNEGSCGVTRSDVPIYRGEGILTAAGHGLTRIRQKNKTADG
jgi:hypothetical protein